MNNTLSRAAKALGDPGRLHALKLLEHGERCLCEIQAQLALAQPTVSRHMKVLVEAGLVIPRRSGQWVHYRLAEAADGTPPAVLALLDVMRQHAALPRAAACSCHPTSSPQATMPAEHLISPTTATETNDATS